jgi:hypothetical protein
MGSISMGKETVKWLSSIMEELLKVDVAKEFLKSYKVGSKAFIIQTRNRSGLGVIWL